jgi:hypothetical protein
MNRCVTARRRATLLFLEFMPAQRTTLFRPHLRPGATALGRQHQRAIDRAFY